MRWGEPATVYRVASSTTDLQTGLTSESRTVYAVDRAVLIDGPGKRDFVYHRSFIAASREFIYGGTFDDRQGFIVIDATDLPIGFTFRQEDYVVINNRRLQIKTAEMLDGVAIVINYSELVDQPVAQVHELIAKDYLDLLEAIQ